MIYFIRKDISEYFELEYRLDKKQCYSLLFSNKKYFYTLHTIIEINKRYNQKKYKDYLIISLLRGIVLNVESFITEVIDNINIPNIDNYINNKKINLNKITIDCEDKKEINRLVKNHNRKYNIEKLNKLDLFEKLELLSDSSIFQSFKNLKLSNDFYENIIKLNNQENNKEKYFFIFQKARNHVAHNHINFNELFNNNAEKISILLNSIIFIMIYLEYLKNNEKK